MVKEFYSNMVGMKDKAVYVRGRWISFSRDHIQSSGEKEWVEIQKTGGNT